MEHLLRHLTPGPHGCIVWTGTLTRYGYGQLRSRKDRNKYAHRVWWEMTHGPIPDGMVLDHWRLNEVLDEGETLQCSKACVAHTRLVSQKQNLHDSPTWRTAHRVAWKERK